MFENLITSIENGIKLVDGLYHIKNCLSQSELNLCKELYKSPGEKVPLQEDRPRLQRIVDFDFSKIFYKNLYTNNCSWYWNYNVFLFYVFMG